MSSDEDAAVRKLMVMMERVLTQISEKLDADKKKKAGHTDKSVDDDVPSRGGYPRPYVS